VRLVACVVVFEELAIGNMDGGFRMNEGEMNGGSRERKQRGADKE
jgi:hypothetical protein